MIPKSKPKASASILVVDDLPANLQVLADLLQNRGYEVRPVPSGELALQAARHKMPDLILLDINMSKMDGYQVCEKLKQDPQLSGVPVIFLSALGETIDKVKGFKLGAVDYITKPFQLEEVEARVNTHLTHRRQELELEKSYAHIQEIERMRDSLVHMIVHDMRSPLSAILMALDALQTEPAPDPALIAKLIKPACRAGAALRSMITQLLDISRLEAGQMPIHKECQDLACTLRESLESLASMAAGRKMELDAPAPFTLAYDQDLVSRVVVNLLSNAIKSTPPGGQIKLSLTLGEGFARIAVADNGCGIAPEYHRKIFEKFSQTELREKRVGTGLGLAYCKLAVESHGGQIGVESAPGSGSTFWFTLPLETTDSSAA